MHMHGFNIISPCIINMCIYLLDDKESMCIKEKNMVALTTVQQQSYTLYSIQKEKSLLRQQFLTHISVTLKTG